MLEVAKKCRGGARVLAEGFVLLLLSACGEELFDSAEQSVQPGELPAAASVTCTTMVLQLAVDPDLAGSYLTPGRQLALDEQGAAKLWITVNDCDHFAFGDDEYGPASFVAPTLAVVGPYEVAPVPDTAITLPTSYYQEIGLFNDSMEIFQYEHRLGVAIKLAKTIALGAPGDAGYVYERGDVGFAWQEQILTTPLPYPIGSNTVIYRDDDLTPAIERMSCAVYGLVRGSAVVSVHPESLIAPFGAQLVGTTADGTFDCQATFTAQET